MADQIDTFPAKSNLAEVEDERPRFLLSGQEFKLLFIARSACAVLNLNLAHACSQYWFLR